ncbi:hypothetical protein Pelo_11233 [Pelomyxa schiedti]|nr:hypothetical protein Pelo_11233 [Pelomyxa schiedti]
MVIAFYGTLSTEFASIIAFTAWQVPSIPIATTTNLQNTKEKSQRGAILGELEPTVASTPVTGCCELLELFGADEMKAAS